MNSKIIFWFLKKTHGHSKPQVGTKIRKFEPCGRALPESCTREKREKREKRERKKGEREKEKL